MYNKPINESISYDNFNVFYNFFEKFMEKISSIETIESFDESPGPLHRDIKNKNIISKEFTTHIDILYDYFCDGETTYVPYLNYSVNLKEINRKYIVITLEPNNSLANMETSFSVYVFKQQKNLKYKLCDKLSYFNIIVQVNSSKRSTVKEKIDSYSFDSNNFIVDIHDIEENHNNGEYLNLLKSKQYIYDIETCNKKSNPKRVNNIELKNFIEQKVYFRINNKNGTMKDFNVDDLKSDGIKFDNELNIKNESDISFIIMKYF